MLRFRGVPLPGFAIGTLVGIILMVTVPLTGIGTLGIALTCVGFWLVIDLVAVSVVTRDQSPVTVADNEGGPDGAASP